MAFLDNYGQVERAQNAIAQNADALSVDAIVVLGSHVRSDGQAGNSLTRRARHAAALYHKKVAAFIVCTGAIGDHAPSEAQSAAQILQHEGVPDSAILLEEQSHSTWQNIVNTTAICRKRGWTKVVVVSEPYHLWRAERNFRDCGIAAFASPAQNPPPRVRLQMVARECLSVIRDFLNGR